MDERNEGLINRLRTGEKILCPKCHKGYFDVSGDNLENSNYFHCDNCDNYVHVNFPIDIE